VQIGFSAPTSGPLIGPDSLTRIVTEGKVLGFDYVTISDHIMVPRNLVSRYRYTDTGELPAGTPGGLARAADHHRVYRRADDKAAVCAVGDGGAAPARRADRQAVVDN
jgi:hypothetical protein